MRGIHTCEYIKMERIIRRYDETVDEGLIRILTFRNGITIGTLIDVWILQCYIIIILALPGTAVPLPTFTATTPRTALLYYCSGYRNI